MKYGKYELSEKEESALRSIKAVISSYGLDVYEASNVTSVLQSMCSRCIQKGRRNPVPAKEAI